MDCDSGAEHGGEGGNGEGGDWKRGRTERVMDANVGRKERQENM